MNYTQFLKILIASLFSVGLASYQLSNYDKATDYTIQFKTGKAEGSFQGLQGKVVFNKADLLNAMIDVSVDVNTIQTGNEKKDEHAIGKKWFDASTYPTMKFVSKQITKLGTGYIAEGELTVKDVTRSVEIPFAYVLTNDKGYLQGRFRINRKDYNVKGNFFGFTVGKDVDILLNVPANYASE